MSSPAFVFVHGWGQAVQTWHGQLEFFASSHEVLAVNLPGHGGAPDLPAEAWEETILESLPDEPVVLIGWSLGGMLGLRLALHHPARLAGLVLISTTPSFRLRSGWSHACADDVFERFQESLEINEKRLLDRFFALMLQGDALDRRRYLDIVRQAVDRQHPSSPNGLRAGLDLLDQLDLRDSLSGISVPTLVVHGRNDAIVPVGAAEFLAAQIPDARLQLLSAGHAPHLTQPETLNGILEEWCRNSISTQRR